MLNLYHYYTTIHVHKFIYLFIDIKTENLTQRENYGGRVAVSKGYITRMSENFTEILCFIHI